MAASILDQVTIVGNVGNLDGEYAWSPAQGDNNARFTFSVAVTPSVRNQTTNEWEDGVTAWHNVTLYGSMAENAHDTLQKGDQVIVIGHNRAREYQKKDGSGTAVSIDIIADYFGVSLRWATATVNRQGGQRSAGTTTSAPRHSSAPAHKAPASKPAAPAAPADDISLDGDDTFDELFS